MKQPTPSPRSHRQDAQDLSRRFGEMVRKRRKSLGMTQDEVALASAVSRRFVIELEAGRPTCELGRSLMVATTVGLRPAEEAGPEDADLPLLPDIIDNGEPE